MRVVSGFDVTGPLPTGVTVLEASAGTGKTYTIAALAARYVAEGTPLDELLLVTFTRMATSELRERVRDRLVAVEHAPRRRQRIFQSGGAIEQHGALVATDAAVAKRLLERGVSGRAFRAHQKAFLARDFVDGIRNRLVGDRDGEAAAVAYRAQDEEIADCLRNADA